MRVIAGKYRSRKLQAPPGLDTRPSSDRLRETLFNVVAPRTPDSVWIDLFAGTGAVGIEALSRGAQFVYFVDTGKKAIRAMRENFESLGIEEGFEIIQGEAASAVNALDQRGVECDICFIDPPYDSPGAYEQTLRSLAASELLSPQSMVIVEHEKHFEPGDRHGNLERYRELRQGDSVLSFYRRKEAE